MPTNYDFVLDQGTTWSQTLTLRDAAGNSQDLSNATITLLAASAFGATPVLSLSSGGASPAIVISGSTITITASSTATKALPAGAMVYSLDMAVLGVVTRLMQGSIVVVPGVLS